MTNECYSTDRINAVCEQLARFILNEILDASSTTMVTSIKDFHRHLEGLNSWTIHMNCTFVNISKYDALLFVYL